MMVIYDFWTPVFFAKKGKFVTIVCQEKPFNGAYAYFNSFIPKTYKTSLIKSLLFQCFSL